MSSQTFLFFCTGRGKTFLNGFTERRGHRDLALKENTILEDGHGAAQLERAFLLQSSHLEIYMGFYMRVDFENKFYICPRFLRILFQD